MHRAGQGDNPNTRPQAGTADREWSHGISRQCRLNKFPYRQTNDGAQTNTHSRDT